METIIVITECTNPYGKYWEFRDKQSGQVLAEVDRKKRSEFDGPLYWVYEPRGGFNYETSRHNTKDQAIEKAKKNISEQFAGVDIKFKWSPIVKHFKWS